VRHVAAKPRDRRRGGFERKVRNGKRGGWGDGDGGLSRVTSEEDLASHRWSYMFNAEVFYAPLDDAT